jgi:hypothetical protein
MVIALASLLFLLLRRGKGKYSLAGQHSHTTLHELNGGGSGGKYGMEYRYGISEMPHHKEHYRGLPPVEMDAGKMDAGKMDAGKMDAGKMDAGKMDGYFGPPIPVR